MGVFNTVKSSMKCLKCGQMVEWQSKRLVYDGILVANAMQTITLNEKMNGEMHGFCDSCKTSIDVVIEKGEIIGVKSYKSKSLTKIMQNLGG